MTAQTETADSFSAPAWTLTGFEPLRAAWEYAGMRMMNKSALPPGDGHAIVLFPGLASDKHAIGPLKDFCEELGYVAYDWGRGFNTGPQGDPESWLDGLAEHVSAMVSAHPERVSLVGWSLGGIYAREVAKRMRGRVRNVITIGTPFAGTGRHTRAGLVYRLLNGSDAPAQASLAETLKTAPDVPTTSIYSRSDGVVAWQACIQAPTQTQVENIEVSGSHCGLGWNAEVFGVLADRLEQPYGAWKPYEVVANRTKSRRRLV